MNHNLPPDWIDAFLDGELSPEERTAAESQLSENASDQEQFALLRELDGTLRRALSVPEFSANEFLTRLDGRRFVTNPETPGPALVRKSREETQPTEFRSSMRTRMIAVATSVTLLLVVAAAILSPQFSGFSIRSFPKHAAGVARIERTVGPVEFHSPLEKAWHSFDGSTALPVVAGTRLRTPPSSLCEVETVEDGVLRMNENTELIVHAANTIELVTGEFWCSASGNSPLAVIVPGQQAHESGNSSISIPPFLCPTDGELQWSATEKQTTCLGASDSVINLTTPTQKSFSVAPGQWISVVGQQNAPDSGFTDRLLATGWQMPLLAVRSPNDPVLQARLESLLATVGQSKLSMLYDSQIRSLGPPGTLPLIALVRSPGSQKNPELRHRAMQIIAELAPESARSDLEILALDSDPVVAELAASALQRLSQPQKA